MKIILILFINVFVIQFCQAQVTILAQPNILAPPSPSVNLNTDKSTEYKGQYDIVLKPGFEVVQSGNTNTSKYFLGVIEYALLDVEYAILDKEYSAGFVTTINSNLYFVYDEKYTTGVLNYQVYDYLHNPIVTTTLKTANPTLNLSRTVVGKNFFQLNMALVTGGNIGAEFQRYYTLEVTNDKNEKFVLRFKYS